MARLRFSHDGVALGIQFANRNLQLYSVQTAAQLKRQAKRRLTKKRRVSATGVDADGGGGDEGDAGGEELGKEDDEAAKLQEVADGFQPLCHLRGALKLHSFAWAGGRTAVTGDKGVVRAKTARLLVAERSNSLKVYKCDLTRGGAVEVVCAVEAPGDFLLRTLPSNPQRR